MNRQTVFFFFFLLTFIGLLAYIVWNVETLKMMGTNPCTICERTLNMTCVQWPRYLP